MQQWLKDFLYGALFITALTCLFTQGAVNSGYTWQWANALPYFITPSDDHLLGFRFGPLITIGLVTTIYISAVALFISLIAGMATAILQLIGGPLSRMLCTSYVQLIRNTPLMVQLFVVYMLVPGTWNISATTIAIITLGMFEGAYLAEIFRAGILSIPATQWEAGQSLGLSTHTCWTHIILPQALRNCLPPTVSQGISLIKDSSLASVIAVSELAQQSTIAVSDSFLSFEIWLPVAGIYLMLALMLSALTSLLERHLAKHTRMANNPPLTAGW